MRLSPTGYQVQHNLTTVCEIVISNILIRAAWHELPPLLPLL